LWLHNDCDCRAVTTAAHVTAVEFEFTLYRWVKTPDGRTWEKEDAWKASLADERAEDVASLHRPQSHGDAVESALDQLIDFVRNLARTG
jgi:hypothetical protein